MTVHGPPFEKGQQNRGSGDFIGIEVENIAVQHDKIG